MDKFLIIGLGNPGNEYVNTRHNVGFMVLDVVADKLSKLKGTPLFFKSQKLGDGLEFTYKGKWCLLLKPNTFMNLSGKAVAYYIQQEKIDFNKCLVVADDLAIDFGSIRLRKKGSDGGHNGLKNIQEVLNSTEYPRLRVGIGSNFPKGVQVNYVLSPFSKVEQESLQDVLNYAADAIFSFLFDPIDQAMTKFNGKAPKRN